MTAKHRKLADYDLTAYRKPADQPAQIAPRAQPAQVVHVHTQEQKAPATCINGASGLLGAAMLASFVPLAGLVVGAVLVVAAVLVAIIGITKNESTARCVVLIVGAVTIIPILMIGIQALVIAILSNL